MKIAVLGDTGHTGLQFVLEALKNEHEVFALVRNPAVTNDKLKVMKVDIFKEDDLIDTFKNTDAVVSCLGCRPSLFNWSQITFYIDSMKVIVEAMRKANKQRLVCISSWATVSREIRVEEAQHISSIQGRMPRRDVAIFMLECAITQDWNKKCVAIGLKPIATFKKKDVSSEEKDASSENDKN